jgi:tetratricopeptide (TPR) repeat protein
VSIAIMNLGQALMMLGDWDAAERELTQAVDADGDDDYLSCQRGWLAALRGDAATAETSLGRLRDLRSSEDPQDKALISLVKAFTAVPRHQPETALRCARDVLAHAEGLGISHEFVRWAWTLAARSAYELQDTAVTRELLALLDSYQPGHLAPMLRAERSLVRARLGAQDGEEAAAALFTSAVRSLRELGTPYHLAHGLLDHAEHLAGRGDADAATLAIGEARDIASSLRCQPLLDRVTEVTPAQARTRN